MKKILFALFVTLFILSACTPQAVPPAADQPAEPTTASAAPIIVTDALDREVKLEKAPQRIAITGKALTLVMDAVYMFPEAAQRVVALGKSGQSSAAFNLLIDPNYEEKTILEQEASAEQIAAARPDLVILKSYLRESMGMSVETLNIPVLYVDLETPEQYERDLTNLGKIFQNEARAQQLISYYQNQVANVQNAVKDVSQKPRILLLYYSDKDGVVAFNVPPMSWMQTRLVEMAGGEPIWADANPGKGWTKVTLEQIAAWDADQIFVISYFANPSEVVGKLKEDAQWQALRAVKEGKLYAFARDFYSWDQPDARWVLGLTWLATRIHPDRFPQTDIVQTAQQFYQTVYGLDAKVFEEKIRPAFKGDLP